MIKSIDKILVPVDNSEATKNAACMAFTFARVFHASITLIHIHIQEKALRELVIIDSDEIANSSQDQFNKLLFSLIGDPASTAAQLGDDHRSIDLSECEHNLADEICRYAKVNNINLIVMGAHEHAASMIRELLLGSVSGEVIHKTPCPVTIVH